MKKQIKAVFGILSFVVLLGAAFFAYNTLSDNTDISENIIGNIVGAENIVSDMQRAPDFAMEDAMGNEVRLSDFLGQPVVLNFWATWCPNCVLETPYFEALYQEMGGDVQILKVNLIGSRGETRSAVNSFMDTGNYTLPLYFDIYGDGAQAFSIRFIPATFFITPEGYIASNVQGAINETTLRNGIDMITE